MRLAQGCQFSTGSGPQRVCDRRAGSAGFPGNASGERVKAEGRDKSSPQHPYGPHPSRLSASGVHVSPCSSSMPVSGHCSVEKDRDVFSLDALLWTFSAWAKGWEASFSRVAAGKERWHLAWMRGQWTPMCLCWSSLGQPSILERSGQADAIPTAPGRLSPPDPSWPCP